MFKSVDRRIADLGFKVVEENRYGVAYEREYKGGYPYGNQRVEIYNEGKGGMPILQSYETGSTCCVVPVPYDELRLFMKKMRKLGMS